MQMHLVLVDGKCASEKSLFTALAIRRCYWRVLESPVNANKLSRPVRLCSTGSAVLLEFPERGGMHLRGRLGRCRSDVARDPLGPKGSPVGQLGR